jgi:hypothetical protein
MCLFGPLPTMPAGRLLEALTAPAPRPAGIRLGAAAIVNISGLGRAGRCKSSLIAAIRHNSWFPKKVTEFLALPAKPDYIAGRDTRWLEDVHRVFGSGVGLPEPPQQAS